LQKRIVIKFQLASLIIIILVVYHVEMGIKILILDGITSVPGVGRTRRKKRSAVYRTHEVETWHEIGSKKKE